MYKLFVVKKKKLNVQIMGGSKLRSARGKFFPGKNKRFEYLDYTESKLRNCAVCKEVREVNCSLAGTGHKSARLPDWPQTSFSHDRHQEHN